MHKHDFRDEFHARLLDPKRKSIEDPEKFIPELLSGNEVVVDMGCGPGYYCPVLEKYSSKLYCVDIDEKALSLAKGRATKDSTVFLNEPATNTSIPSGVVDVVVFSNSFHDMDRESAYKETIRLLKPCGKVIIVDWKKEPTPMGPPLEVRMSRQDYSTIFKDFEIVKEFEPGPYHFGLVMKRKC
ncbi:MAG: class I SAM-dependent methyltransferase [Metallosphaera yellowstonensis]|jgi:SAM-dependent methyltransferase